MRLLFRKGNTFERYDAQRHGVWEIVKGADGKLVNRRSGGGSDAETADDPAGAFGDVLDTVDAGASVFAAEAHLRDYLAKNLGQIEPGLSLYHGPDDTIGIEYETNVGIIDLLAVDASGEFVVIELKVRKTSDAVVGQALRYRNWVRHHLADGHAVRAIVVAETVTEKIRYAIEGLPDFGLLTYEIHFDVHAVPPLNHLAPETLHIEGQQ